MSLVRIGRAGAVRTVTLARPEKRNAINAEMMAAIRAAFEAEPDADERVTVLRSEGPVFCSGLQLSSGGVDPAEAMNIEGMFTAVQHYPLPVVAVVQGAAIAGGRELALHSGLVFCPPAEHREPMSGLAIPFSMWQCAGHGDAAGPGFVR